MKPRPLKNFSTDELKAELAARKAAERYERNKAKNPMRCERCIYFRAIMTAFNALTACYHSEPKDVEFDKKACRDFQPNESDVIWL